MSYQSFPLQWLCVLHVLCHTEVINWKSCHWLCDKSSGDLSHLSTQIELSPTLETLCKEEERLATVNAPDTVTPTDNVA